MKTEIEKNIIKAKIEIIKEEPFYARFLAELTIKEDKNCPSCYINTKKYEIRYGKEFFKKLNIEQIQTVIMHETLQLLETIPGSQVKLITMDYSIQQVFELTKENKEELIQKELEGGGGTSHEPVYKYLLEKEKDIQCLINFTDGYTVYPKKKEYPFDSLWIITKTGTKKKAPIGKTIWINK